MKRTVGWTLVALLLVGLVAGCLAGCGGTTKVKIGDTEVEKKGGSTTVKTDNGETSITTTKVPTEAELGVPVYPNSKMDETSMLTNTNAKGLKEVVAAQLWTDDSTDKVIAWYKSKLTGKSEYHEMPVTEGGVNEMVFAWKEGDVYKTVQVGAGKVDHPGKTVIGIAAAGASSVPGSNTNQ